LSYNFIFRKQFYFIFSGLKIIGHENPDNNFESPYKSVKNRWGSNSNVKTT